MVSEMIDYVAAAVGIVLVFVAAVFFFNGMVTNGVAYATIRNQALQAQSLFDYILLTTGSPAIWGTSYQTPSAFGLAAPYSQPYTLSAFSVNRLIKPFIQTIGNTNYYVENTTGTLVIVPKNYYVNYTYVKQILNITGKFEFQITIQPLLSVRVIPLNSPRSFNVLVNSYSGVPMEYASVTGILIFPQKTNPNSPSEILTFSNTTSANQQGSAKLVFSNAPTNMNVGYYVLVTVNAGGLTGKGYYTNINPSQTLAYVALYPNQVNITQHCAVQNSPPCGVDVFNATLLIPNGASGYSLKQLVCSSNSINAGQGQGNTKKYATCNFQLIDGFIAIAIQQVGNSQINSDPQILLVPLGLNQVGGAVVYGANPKGSVAAFTLSRVVQIGGVSYAVNVVYWSDYGPVYGG